MEGQINGMEEREKRESARGVNVERKSLLPFIGRGLVWINPLKCEVSDMWLERSELDADVTIMAANQKLQSSGTLT